MDFFILPLKNIIKSLHASEADPFIEFEIILDNPHAQNPPLSTAPKDDQSEKEQNEQSETSLNSKPGVHFTFVLEDEEDDLNLNGEFPSSEFELIIDNPHAQNPPLSTVLNDDQSGSEQNDQLEFDLIIDNLHAQNPPLSTASKHDQLGAEPNKQSKNPETSKTKQFFVFLSRTKEEDLFFNEKGGLLEFEIIIDNPLIQNRTISASLTQEKFDSGQTTNLKRAQNKET